MSISTDGNNLILNSTSNTISIICSSTNTLATNLYVPFGFLIPSTAITPATDEKIGRTSTINSTNGTISSATIKNLGATYTFTSPGIYLIVLYLSITPSTTPLTITNCGFGVSTSGEIVALSNVKLETNITTSGRCLGKTMTILTVPTTATYYFVAQISSSPQSATWDRTTSFCICTRIA